jgi:hypothetical protein
MELTETIRSDESDNPLDVLEALLADNDWAFDRAADDELTVIVQGHWCTHHVSFTWHEQLEAMHLACTFDVKVPREKRAEIAMLLTLINEQLWCGHFDMWSDDGMLIFRHGMLLHGGVDLTREQAHALFELPIDACERYYPAFQFVLWGGKSAADAMVSTMLDTAGQA